MSIDFHSLVKEFLPDYRLWFVLKFALHDAAQEGSFSNVPISNNNQFDPVVGLVLGRASGFIKLRELTCVSLDRSTQPIHVMCFAFS